MGVHDVRLIERWLPIAELGEESNRERRSMTALPPVYYLHVWWARRPLVASRAAILASLLPDDADRTTFMHILGIHGDPVATKRRIDEASHTGEDLGPDPYGYKRAFLYSPSDSERRWLARSAVSSESTALVLDPTAGGGSIPFEAARLGLRVAANDLNAVAALLLELTVRTPRQIGAAALDAFQRLAKDFVARAEPEFVRLFPSENEGTQILGYLWARTISCPYCDGLVPLAPNWRLAPNGVGVRLLPRVAGGRGTVGRVCHFEIVYNTSAHSAATVAGGDATCAFPDCGRVIPGDVIKFQAQAGNMDEQLFAIAFKRRIEKRTKSGKPRLAWERGYRAPTDRDEVLPEVKRRLSDRLPIWEAREVVPTEAIPEGNKTAEPIRYGMTRWRDLFNPRQLYGHCIAADIYRELFAEKSAKNDLTPENCAAFGYLALTLDKMLNYNSRMSIWIPAREIIANTFNRHDFAFCWSYAEMAPFVVGLGFDWAIEQTSKCVRELIELASVDALPLLSASPIEHADAALALTCENATNLTGVADSSVDIIVIDPPYGGNVMYAELSDFFYVWLKRTAALAYPDLFRTRLTDKEHEAVANPARFEGQHNARALAEADYRQKMAAIFAECRRVLKPSGMMTLMFTHKATGAWDALARGLIEAGFTITASWPINTESESSLHIRDKAAANSTIFLACRPRVADFANGQIYWDDLEVRVRAAVRQRIGEFQAAGIRGVDLYLASFGPALQILSEHWPVQRIAPRPIQSSGKRRRTAPVFEEADPYAVTPEDALEAARTEVKRWRLEHLSKLAAREGLDPITSWFVLAWDTFESAVFPYDEALRLARVCGVSLDSDIIDRYASKKGDNLTLWDSSVRAAKHTLGTADGSAAMLDAVHHATNLARTRSLAAARVLLEEHQLVKRPAFVAAFDAVRQVLPVSADYSGQELPGTAVGAGDDFRALEDLRKLLYATELAPPQQLLLLSAIASVPAAGT
jgi:putative DNA methylase